MPPASSITVSRGILRAQTPEQAQLLLDQTNAKLFERLLERECSATELADHAKLSLRQAHHKLTRLLEAELIEVCGQRPRGGRPIKLYRALAQEYRVPFGLTAAESYAELLSSMFWPFMASAAGNIAKLLSREQQWEVTLRRPDDEGIFYSLSSSTQEAEPGERVRANFTFFEYQLSREHQRELSGKMHDLLEWVRACETQDTAAGTASPCIISLLLVPGAFEP